MLCVTMKLNEKQHSTVLCKVYLFIFLTSLVEFTRTIPQAIFTAKISNIPVSLLYRMLKLFMRVSVTD